MGKLTSEVFNESCCDGGAVCENDSCQPCGCDPKANWVCAGHQKERLLSTGTTPASTGTYVSYYGLTGNLPPKERSERVYKNPKFHKLLTQMQEMHERKSHDYAKNSNPYSNFEEAAACAGCTVDEV